MAKTILPIAGAVVGFWIGGPAGAQWGYAAGSLLSAAIPNQVQGPRIGETGAQTSQEGAPRSILYGTAQVSGNVIASGPLIKRDVEESQGKGGTDVSTEHAYRTFAVRICEGPVAGILRVWEDEKLVYDIRPESTMSAESLKWLANKVFYLGDEEQLPDPSLQMIFGVDETPAHRGSAYMVAIEEDLTDRRGSIKQYRFEVASEGWVNQELNRLFGYQGSNVGYNGSLSDGLTSSVLFNSDGDYGVWLVEIAPVYSEVSPPSVLSATLTIAIEDGPTFSRLVVVGETLRVQVETESKPFTVTVVIHVSGPNVQGRVAAEQTATIAGYTQYPNHSPGGDFLLSSSEYFGVVIDEDGVLWACAWGPDQIEIVGDGAPVPLSEIVSDIHARCDFPAGKADVSELDDMVTGLVLAGDYTGADAINTLRALYLFDAADQDKIIVYPKRGKAVVATITENDIVEAEESTKREQAIEYPKKLHLSYQNAVGGYAVAKATSARSSPDVRVVGEVTTQVPVVLNPDQAAQAAAIMHKIAWAEAEGETKLSVPLSWIRFIASDCFGVALRGRVTRERLDELNTADGVIEYTLRRDRQSAYTSNVTGIPISEPTPPPSTIVGDSVLAVIDISPRLDSEDDLNLLYAVSGALPPWPGATVQRSLDGGANYSSVVNINRGPIIGVLVNPLADASEWYTDTTNVVRVQLYRETQTIEGISDAQFLSEGGSFVIERPDGSWEVLQYRDATEVSPGIYDLSHLHRGQLNSGTTSHLADAMLVMLERAVHAPAQSAWIGATLTHRAVTYGESPETADEESVVYVGRSQIEWPIAYLSLARDGSNNITGAWSARHRFGTEDSPVASVNFRGFRVTLDDGVLPTVTFDTTEPEFGYDASGLGSPLTVTVAAINRITGPGPSTSGAI